MTALCGAIGTCIGAWVKVFSVDPELFYVGFIGQSIVATSQVRFFAVYECCNHLGFSFFIEIVSALKKMQSFFFAETRFVHDI